MTETGNLGLNPGDSRKKKRTPVGMVWGHSISHVAYRTKLRFPPAFSARARFVVPETWHVKPLEGRIQVGLDRNGFDQGDSVLSCSLLFWWLPH